MCTRIADRLGAARRAPAGQSASAVDPTALNILKNLPRRSASRPRADLHTKRLRADADQMASTRQRIQD